MEIDQSILIGKFRHIGPAYCMAFLEAEANVLPKVPFNLFFPIKEQCSRTGSATPPATIDFYIYRSNNFVVFFLNLF